MMDTYTERTQSIEMAIAEMACAHQSGADTSAMIPQDFHRIAPLDQVVDVLDDLVKKGLLRKPCPGVYSTKEWSRLLDDFASPDPERVAHAWARAQHRDLFPSKLTCLNVWGLSTQVPAHYVFEWDGPDHDLQIEGTPTVRLRHSDDARFLARLGHPLLISLVQAIISASEREISLNQVATLVRRGGNELIKEFGSMDEVLKRCRYIPSTVYEVIRWMHEHERAQSM